uniref:c-Myc-binding protein n=1 Tax=Caligus clemensi TaxID=344056 RepID=C1C2E8_CALCM|nr:C-Myc-binding protein [Caligus clemensi]
MTSKSANPIDAKREEFRKYLEREGILQSLTSVLVSLYEEPEKPKDGLLYLKNNFARGSANAVPLPPQNDEELAKLKEQNATLLLKIDELEKLNADLQKELQTIKSSPPQQNESEESPKAMIEAPTPPKEEPVLSNTKSAAEPPVNEEPPKEAESKMEANIPPTPIEEDEKKPTEESMDTSEEQQNQDDGKKPSTEPAVTSDNNTPAT